MITETELEEASTLKWKISATKQLMKNIQKVIDCKEPINYNNFSFCPNLQDFKFDNEFPGNIHINPENLESGIVKNFLVLVYNKASDDLDRWENEYYKIIKL